MWIKPKGYENGDAWANLNSLYGLVVIEDPNDAGNYVVIGQDTSYNTITTLWNGSAMTQSEAREFAAKLADLMGSYE